MPSTYTSSLGVEKPANGEQSNTWGDTANDNYDILDAGINGVLALSLSGTSSTLTTTNGALSDGQYKVLVLGGSPSGTHTITVSPNTAPKLYFVSNASGQSVVFTQGSGGNVTIATGTSATIYCDGGGATAAVVNLNNTLASSGVKITGGAIDGTAIGATTPSTGAFSSITLTTDLSVANGGTGVSTLTGLVKGNGASAFSAAVAGTDYLAPAAIGSSVQAYDAGLTSIAGLTTAADKMIYTTAPDTYAVADLTAYGRSVVAVANEAAFKALVNLEIGTDVQAYNAGLGQIAALADPNADRVLIWDDSAGAYVYATLGTGLTISGTTITAPGARVLLATKTASASATLDFTEFDNSTYTWYEFEYENVKPATDGVSLMMRVSTDAGSSYDAGAANYHNASWGSTNTTSLFFAGTATALYISSTDSTMGNAAGEYGLTGSSKLYNSGLASRARVITHASYDDTLGNQCQHMITGVRLADQDTTAVRFLFGSGSIASGTVRMYGIA